MKELTPQQKNTLEFEKHISLTANAGSGKTFVLAKRFVEVYLKNEITINQIVAITFTDKAAGELKHRIFNEVEERLSNEHDDQFRKKLERLRRELVFSNISTIHSFCTRILREHALDAGIDASFSPIDSQTSQELIELAVEETFQQMIRDESLQSSLKYLIRLFGSKNSLRINLEKAIHQRKIIERLKENLYYKTEDEIARYFHEQFEIHFMKVFAGKVPELLQAINKINDHVIKSGKSNEKAFDIKDFLKLAEWNSTDKIIESSERLRELMLTKENSVRKQGYLSKDREKFTHEADLIERYFEEISLFFQIDKTGGSEKELAYFGKCYLSAFEIAENFYSNKKKQHAYLDFEDILLFTQKIIQTESLQKYLSSNYKFIMIDEYQDTNELQYEIFMPLLDKLHSGNLFVVGDEKQSIYMFREAELEVFNKTKREIQKGENPGLLLNLPHSFRMAPQLVLFTNRLFKKLFENPITEFNEVEHSDLVCAKSEDEKGFVQVIKTVSDSEITEAELVSKKILQIIESDDSISFKDVAILCRKRDLFYELEQKFTAYKIPFTIIGGKSFYQRQLIYDVYNYLTFLVNPKDDVALIGLLRSPFFKLPDAKIFIISMTEGDSFYEKLRIKSASDDKLNSICKILEENIGLAFHKEINLLIRKILVESDYWTILASRKNSDQEIANMEKLLALARGYSSKGFKTLYDFTVSLREAIEGLEDEGQAQIAGDANTVKMMTIHQAKGLEFKVVIIYAANQKGQDDTIKSKTMSADKNFGLLTKVPSHENYFNDYITPPIVSYYNFYMRRKGEAELKRLLYVAVTRAAKYLIISFTHKDHSPVGGSFYELFCRGLDSDFSGEELRMFDEIEFMKSVEGKYQFFKKDMELNISIEENLSAADMRLNEIQMETSPKKLITGKITDIPKHEIISATKISMFAQCPVKYQLTYELGYSPIMNLVKEQTNEFEFQYDEDDELKRYARLRGKLIHQALCEEITIEKLAGFINQKLSGEEAVNDRDKFIESIIEDISRYQSSMNFHQISSYANFKNEFEAYCKEGEYFLYGIIDKLIYDGDKLIIIDYKTDTIPKEKIRNRADNYLPQLRFYAYVLSHLYPAVNEFKMQLLFIKHPNEQVEQVIDRNQMDQIGNSINSAIKKIYSYDYQPNLSHCVQCQFALDGNKCIKEFSKL